MAKVALLFHLCCGVVSLGAVVGLWFVADRIGTREQLESFLGDLLGTKDFQLFGDKLFRAAIGVTGALIVLATVGTVVMAFLYNMLSSIFGGVVVSVLQERVPLPKDVVANAEAAQAEANPRPKRRRRRRKKRPRPVPALNAPLYEPPVAAAPTSVIPSNGGLPSAAREATAVPPTPSDDSLQVWAPEPISGTTPAPETDGDNWIGATSDPTGSWMSPGSRS